MRIALIGQPNCGKSTLFNQVAGYKAETGNFSGTTVTYTETKTRVLGQVINLVDLPGTYTLTGTNPAEREVFNYLLGHEIDAIINVVDASHLAQGLELTLELLELDKPLILALNMVDEARRLGISIDLCGLGEMLNTPVLPLIASRGQGIKNLFITAFRAAKDKVSQPRQQYSQNVEKTIDLAKEHLRQEDYILSIDAAAIKMVEKDAQFEDDLAHDPKLSAAISELEAEHGQEAMWIISGERHAIAANISHKVVTQGEKRTTWRDRMDDLLLHPVWGYFFLIVIFFLFFQMVFQFGRLVETPLLEAFEEFNVWTQQFFAPKSILSVIVLGLVQGITGGVAIVLPYLVPFLIGLGFLEDVGYLPRIAFLMDSLMHRLGLHGKAIVPFILGFGCNVPAIMSTRILEDKRDQLLAAVLTTLVPCAARLAVVFGLVAFYLGPGLALVIYLYNLVVIAFVAKLLSRALPEDTPGLIFEMPVYRAPTWRTVVQKAWYRIREFIFEAWPILIIGSLVLAVLNYFDVARLLNILVRPLSAVLGLPSEVGVPLIFGILRKELSLVMLAQALGSTNFSLVLTPLQMMTYAVFIVFYIPCLATLAVLKREFGWKQMLMISGLTVVIALVASLIVRLVGTIIISL